MTDIERLLSRAENLVDRPAQLLPPAPSPPDWGREAFRWRQSGGHGRIEAVPQPHRVALDDLLCMDAQKAEILRNTRQFVAGRPANNVLLWGARGTGKSTLVKAVFNALAAQGLRLLEVNKAHLVELPDIVAQLQGRPERFVVYCDDLSFEGDDADYKSLKAVLEGSIATPPDNLLVYATSNRRHLLPEYQRENQETRLVDGEIHPGETLEEKTSLSERFGLWLPFYPYTQAQYLAICDHWLRRFGSRETADEATRLAALQWATYRGSRSGRVARQFALDWAERT